jgi:hypothetical protein
MPRRRRSRERQLDLDWTTPLRWADLPKEVRDELSAHLQELLVLVAATGHAEAAHDE